MKKYIKNIACGIIAISMVACSTTQKVTITGTPGTRVYTPAKKELGTIPPSGSLKLTLRDDNYYGLLVTQAPQSDKFVPMAMDYKNKGRATAKIAAGTGMGLAAAGVMSLLIGTIMICSEDDEDYVQSTALPFLGAGGALSMASLGLVAIPSYRLSQAAYKYEYAYMPRQTVNSDMTFKPREIQQTSSFPTAKSHKRTATIPDDEKIDKTTIANEPSPTQKSNRKIKGVSTDFAGTYIGDGYIAMDGEVLEELSGVKITITKISSTLASVKISESDGTEFFGKAARYKVAKEKQSAFVLTHSDINSAIIKINSKGELLYMNPKVEIDGFVYSLNITAKRKQQQ